MIIEGNHQRAWKDGEKRESKLVFIGRGFTAAELEQAPAVAALGLVVSSAPAHAQNFLMNSAETINRGNFKIAAFPTILFAEGDGENETGISLGFGYGFTPSFVDYAGTVSLRLSTLCALVCDVLDSMVRTQLIFFLRVRIISAGEAEAIRAHRPGAGLEVLDPVTEFERLPKGDGKLPPNLRPTNE